MVRVLLTAFGLGVVYAALALEALSPLAIALLLWLALILIWVWRLPLTAQVLGLGAAAFLAGFAGLWLPVLGHIAATCTPPGCQTTEPLTDFFYALAFTAPVVVLASATVGLRALRLRGRA